MRQGNVSGESESRPTKEDENQKRTVLPDYCTLIVEVGAGTGTRGLSIRIPPNTTLSVVCETSVLDVSHALEDRKSIMNIL